MAREMKDSGIEWVGTIPENWDLLPLKYAFSLGKGLSITKSDLVENGYPVISYGQIHAKDANGTEIKGTQIRYVPDYYLTFSKNSLAFRGDIIVADTSEDLEGAGNAAYVNIESIFAGYHTIILKNKGVINGKYTAYLMRTDEWRSQIRQRIMAVKVYSISQSILKDTLIIVPPFPEQTRIADFLDQKCSQIDALVSSIEAQISKLDEYKKALITQAVTKGLDPDTEMKDSDVEWIGMIPKGWKCIRIDKLVTKFFKGVQPIYTEEGIPVANQATFSSGKINKERIRYSAPIPGNSKMCSYGDVLLATTGGGVLGKVAFFDNKEPFIPSTDTAVLRFSSEMKGKYYYYCLSILYNYLNDLFARGSTNQTHLDIGKFRLEKFPVMDSSEMTLIVEYLEQKTDAIDSLKKDLEQKKQTLSDYKKSLIFDYVTGKKEVPADFRKEIQYGE